MGSIVKEPLEWTGGPYVYYGSRGRWVIAVVKKTNEGWNVYPMRTSVELWPILSGPHATMEEAQTSAEDI